ncbi:MAG: sulfatase [Gemmatimonadetes bacterium]|nr:sulfatase [Gemmatimonadota bacterium]|tara:strand:+ start:532 stop:2040 length:1509 start_codon:yes stop_codon:yes gene_type:complete
MPDKTNILLITSDQQHWNTLSCIGSEVKTPNLDRLASRGTLYRRTYCPNPTCTPTRASIITGKYPSQHGAYSLGTKLLESEHTVGEDFTAAGYRTALIGKAHFQPLHGTDEFPSLESYPTLQDLDFWREFDEPFYGFDHIELARNHTDEAHVGQHYAIWLEEKACDNWKDYYRPPTGNNADQKRKWEIPEEFHYGTWIAERSCELLEQYKDNDEPFFLWSSFFDPHPRYLAPEPWDTMYNPSDVTVPSIVEGEHENNPPHFKLTQTKNPDFGSYKSSGQGLHGFGSHLHDKQELAKDIACYYGMISLMDKHIGQIVGKLEALGLAENTLVIFTSDHGHFYGHHGLTAKGAFHYEDMVRVPMIVSQPGKVPEGKVSDSLQSLVDYAPSFLSACDIDIPHPMTGVDQTDVWYGERETVRDHCIVENHHDPLTVHMKTYVEDRYKLTVYYQRDYGELFDLKEDPKEVNNLWYAKDATGLKSELINKLLFAEMGKESLPMPRVSGA